jgi:hypothetical protein
MRSLSATLARLALGAALLATACEKAAQPSKSSSETRAASPMAQDSRISYLLSPASRSEYYDVDTSNTLGILAETLERGHRDPLRRAREELGSMGSAGLEVASRAIDAHFESPDGSAHLRNALEVVHRSSAPEARELCLRVLRHRDIGLAALAAAALEKHGLPEDYERLIACFDSAPPEFKLRFFMAAARLAPERAQRQVLDWIDRGELAGIWDECGSLLAEASAPDVVGRLSPLWPGMPPRFKALLAAPCARAGEEEALGFLREDASSAEQWRAESAVTALHRARMFDELDAVARRGQVASARLRALNSLAAPGIAEQHLEAFRANLNSTDEGLSAAALAVLVRVCDESAIARALALASEGDNEALRTAMSALREPMQSDPALAERVLRALEERRGPETGLGVAEQMRTLQAIGQVPLESAAASLVARALKAQGEVAGMSARRWLLQQASNAGPVGQRQLAKELDTADDTLLRLDLIEAIAAWGGPVSVDVLVRFVESERARPYEILLAAERLTRVGRVEEVAPTLKRVALRVTQADVRVALQALLWLNYPGPR